MEEPLIGKFSPMNKIDRSTKQLELINHWISNCDTKSSFVLTFYGVVLTIIFTSEIGESMISTFSFMRSKELNGESFCYFLLLALSILFFISSLITFHSIYSTLKGRIKQTIYKQQGLKTDSNIFFGSIATKTFQNFESANNIEDDSIYLNDLNSQIFINANIVTQKFNYYNKSLLWMLISLTIFLMYIVIKYC